MMELKRNLTIDARDLWKQAQNEIKKMRPQVVKKVHVQQSALQQNNNTFSFSNAISTLNTFIPSKRQIKTTTKNVPESISFLDNYSQRLGFSSMGQVLSKYGNKYVGRIQQKTPEGNIYFRQFPRSLSSIYDTPNLYVNFTTLANNTIQKWNQFVEAQGKLGNYLTKVKTQQGRSQLMKKYVKLSNKGTDFIRILSSLTYFYLDPKSTDRNFLQLTSTGIDVLKQKIKRGFDVNSLEQKQIMQILQNSTNNKAKFIKYVRNYHQNKVNSIKASLKQQQFQSIRQSLQQFTPYIPPQMVSIPNQKTPQWLKYFNQGTQHNLLIMQRWKYPGQVQVVKLINYF